MDGYQDLPATCAPPPVLRIENLSRLVLRPAGQPPSVPLLTIGDSWLANFDPLLVKNAYSLSTELLKLNYGIAHMFFQKWTEAGRRLAQMAEKVRLDDLGRHLLTHEYSAILLGGGGNDMVDPATDARKTRLIKMLVPNATSASAALDPNELDKFLYKGDGAFVPLIGHYRAILDVVTKKTSAPVFIHAYGFPIPDKRGRLDYPPSGPWLASVFDLPDINIQRPVSDGVMRTLIQHLNQMVAAVAGEYPGKVHHVDLTPVLERQPDIGTNHEKYWANELHASQIGFGLLANEVHNQLVALGVGAMSVPAGPPS
jgi:hypothetical protein